MTGGEWVRDDKRHRPGGDDLGVGGGGGRKGRNQEI